MGRQERQLLRGGDRHSVPWLDPQLAQSCGRSLGPRVEFTISQRAILVVDRRPAGLLANVSLSSLRKCPGLPSCFPGNASVTESSSLRSSA